MGTKLKGLRTDNGLAFVSEQFNEFCRIKGIKRHRTVPRTPQQNVLAERMNRTLLERVRCMLLGAELPKSFWGEAVTTAAKFDQQMSINGNQLQDSYGSMEWETGRLLIFEGFRSFGICAYQARQA